MIAYEQTLTTGENLGRKTKCNARTIARAAEGIRKGMTYALAAQYAGINETTLYAWLKRAKEPDADPVFVKFSEALKAAEADNAATCLDCINDSALDGTWQAAAWMLERRHKYIRPNVVELQARTIDEPEMIDPTTGDGRALVIEHVSQLPEDLILAALNLKSAGNAK